MKNNQFHSLIATCVALLFTTIFTACQENKTESSLQSYFKSTETGVKTGGIKIIPIETPKGKFNIWTKTIGNNPKIKVLLLNGGPGGTHEEFNAACFYACFSAF